MGRENALSLVFKRIAEQIETKPLWKVLTLDFRSMAWALLLRTGTFQICMRK